MTGRLRDKVVLITGTAGGQGRAAAQLFAAEGALVVGCDLDADGDAKTVEMVARARGEMSSSSPLDLTDRSAVEAWIAGAVERHGRIDVLYNNASRQVPVPFAEISAEDWHWTIDNELHLVFYACRAAWPHLAARGGAIINTGSTLGIRAIGGLGNAAHGAAKAAVIMLTRQLAIEGGPHGIRANAVSPSIVDAPVTADLLSIPGAREMLNGMSALGKICTPDDVARAALFLASDESSFLTGVNLLVDGGTTIQVHNPVAALMAESPPPTSEGTHAHEHNRRARSGGAGP